MQGYKDVASEMGSVFDYSRKGTPFYFRKSFWGAVLPIIFGVILAVAGAVLYARKHDLVSG